MSHLITPPPQVRRWDVETGKLLQEAQIHEDAIQDMQISPDGGYVITASLDRTAQLVDIPSLTSLKTYKTGRYVQSAAVSPLFDHVLLGGGQDASQVGVCFRVGCLCVWRGSSEGTTLLLARFVSSRAHIFCFCWILTGGMC